jgi:hypothetical protein
MSHRSLPLLALLGAALAGAPAAAQAATPSTLYVVNAKSGSLIPRGDSTTDFTLTLAGVDAQATWFTDRPNRQAGALTLAELSSQWKRLGFTSDPPNAAIQLTSGDPKADTLIVELGKPHYDRARRVVTLRAKRLGGTVHTIGGHERMADKSIPRRFGSVSLFIDDGTPGFGVTIDVFDLTQDTMTVAYSSLTGASWAAPGPVVGASFNSPNIAQWTTDASGSTAAAGTLELNTSSGAIVTLGWTRAPGSSAPKTTIYGSGTYGLSTAVDMSDARNPTIDFFIESQPY